MTEVKLGIDAIQAEIAVLITLAADVKAAKADGTVDWKDTPKFANLIPVVRTAIAKGKELAAQVKDLDSDETTVVVTALFDAAEALVEALVA